MSSVWIVEKCIAGDSIELRHWTRARWGGSWSGPQLEVGAQIKLIDDINVPMPETVARYAEKLNAERRTKTEKQQPVTRPVQFKTGDRVLTLNGMGEGVVIGAGAFDRNCVRVELADIRLDFAPELLAPLEPSPAGSKFVIARGSGPLTSDSSAKLNPAEAPKFKTGDRVKTAIGDGTIAGPRSWLGTWRVLSSDGHENFFYETELTLIESAPAMSPATSSALGPLHLAAPTPADIPKAKFKVGDRVRVVCECSSGSCTANGKLAKIKYVFMRDLYESQDYELKFDDAHVERGAHVFPERLLEPAPVEPAPAPAPVEPVAPDMTGQVRCLRCGGHAGFLGIRCERVGGCRTAEERVGEPRIMPNDRSGNVLDWDVFSSNVRSGVSEKGWYASGSGDLVAGRRMAAGPFATLDLAIAAWKAVHLR